MGSPAWKRGKCEELSPFPFLFQVFSYYLLVFIYFSPFIPLHQKFLKADLLQKAAECHPWFWGMAPSCQSSFPTFATCCYHLESTRGLSSASQKLQKTSVQKKLSGVVLAVPLSLSLHLFIPTPSIPCGITFCHSQDQTCPNKTCPSFRLSDKPTSSVEDIKHKPAAPQGIPPRYKTCLSSSQGQVFSCEWVFLAVAFPSHRLSAWLHRLLQSPITVCNPCPHPTPAPLCTDCMYDTTWNSKAIVQSRVVTLFFFFSASSQYFVKSDDFLWLFILWINVYISKSIYLRK